MNTKPLPEIRGEGPILLTIQAPCYAEDETFTGMETTLRRRFSDHYAAQQYVAGVKDEGRAEGLSFEITPPADAKPGILAVIERTAAA